MTNVTITTRDERFPRTSDLPKQSPLFWVEQKDRYLRQILIRDIEELTGRRFVVYFSNRYEAGSEIDHRDCSIISEIFRDVGDKPVDFMIETNGGHTDAAESIISYISNITKDLRVVVANAAKSNGTLIALMGNAIVMGPSSELGPIEPSVNQIPCSILVQPEIAKQNYPLHMYGQYALQQSKLLATKLLSGGMLKSAAVGAVDNLVAKLSSRDTYASHGSAIDCNEAAELGLNIVQLGADDELWKRIWLLHCMYEYDCRKSRYLKIFEGQQASTAIAMPLKPLST